MNNPDEEIILTDDADDGHTPLVDIDSLYATAATRFEALARDVRLTFLETKLFRKYFVHAQHTEDKLTGLTYVNQVMQAHRHNTLVVLKRIHEREGVVQKIRHLALDFTRGRLATLEVQTKVLQLLWMHQQVTTHIVEHITNDWRALLTRPYPFNWNGVNYMGKILEDCAWIDACELNNILPLHLSQFPLCSNVTSLSLFSPEQVEQNSKFVGSHGRPPKASKAQSNMDFQHRVVRAERSLFDEDALQRQILRELVGLSSKGFFVTVINVDQVIPECGSGIRVTNKEWDGKLQQALSSIFESYVSSSSSTSQQQQPAVLSSSSGGAGASTSSSPKKSVSVNENQKQQTAEGEAAAPQQPQQKPQEEEEEEVVQHQDDDDDDDDDVDKAFAPGQLHANSNSTFASSQGSASAARPKSARATPPPPPAAAAAAPGNNNNNNVDPPDSPMPSPQP
eukprot:PhM_4_TR16165/c5_g1_i1/m.24599